MINIKRYSETIEIHEFTNMPCATHRIDPKGNCVKCNRWECNFEENIT